MTPIAEVEMQERGEPISGEFRGKVEEQVNLVRGFLSNPTATNNPKDLIVAFLAFLEGKPS